MELLTICDTFVCQYVVSLGLHPPFLQLDRCCILSALDVGTDLTTETMYDVHLATFFFLVRCTCMLKPISIPDGGGI